MTSAVLAAFARSLRGQLLASGQPGYDDARRLFNAAFDRRPALVARCADDADVALAVRFARDQGLPLSVRAGGHAIGGHSVVDAGLVIDLGLRTEITVDEPAGLVSVGAGCRWGPLIDHLDGTGLAASGGFDPRVGVSGLTLGGGYGLLARVHGLACDGLMATDAVTADGGRVRASESEEPDLLWALRGAGANFGVVTRLSLRLHQVPPLWRTAVVLPPDRPHELLRGYRELAAGLPDRATLYLGFALEPGGAGQAQLIGFLLGDRAEAQALLEASARLGTPRLRRLDGMSYRAAHAISAQGFFADGYQHRWKAQLLPGLADPAVDAIADHVARASDRELWLVIEHLGGAVARLAATDTAFPHRQVLFGVVSAVRWRSPAPPELPATLAIQDGLQAALGPSSLGTYVNYVGHPHDAGEVTAAYGPNLPRLRALKRRYDPDNLFRHNVNIRPDQ
jgi:FAD/FMN-containing dehydrogenase